MDRYLDLKNIARMRKLTRDENIEFQALQSAKTAAENNPAVVAAKAEAARQAAEAERRAAVANDERLFQLIFQTVVPGKVPMVAIDNRANRIELASWVHPGEAIPNIQEWYLRVLSETPSLRNRLAMEPYLTPGQKLLEEKDNEQRLRERFELTAKTNGLSMVESNYRLWSSVPDAIVTWFNSKPIILRDDGSEIELIPATEAQKQEWFDQAQKKAFQEKQTRLAEMAAKNDIAGLRKMAALEHAEKNNPQSISSVVQQRVYKELQIQYQRDTQAGFSTPLPAVYTKQEIYKWNADLMRKYVSRYGASRITARIHGLSEIPDGNGGTIKFE